MPPTTRSQTAAPSPGDASLVDEESSVVLLPSRLRYNISDLNERTQDVVRALRRRNSDENREEPPELVVKTCREYRGPDDWYYTFQILETVPYSIRIGSPDSQGYAIPTCHGPHAHDDARGTRRPGGKGKNVEVVDRDPCKHMVFLMDRIAKHTLHNHDPDKELTMTNSGSARELGNAFGRIVDMRLDVLADTIPCDMTSADGNTVTSPTRIHEAQEILAILSGTTSKEVQENLSRTHEEDRIIYRGDLLTTLYSLILSSQHLAAFIRSQLEPSDPPLDPYLALQRRVSRVIKELDEYAHSLWIDRAGSRHRGSMRARHPLEPRMPNIAWAATQIQNCVEHIKILISRRSRDLADWELDSATKALVRILRAVVEHNRDSFPHFTHGSLSKDDRNLYARLIGNHDIEFVYSALVRLEAQTDYIADLELLMDTIETLEYGSPVSYHQKMRSLIARMRRNVPRRAPSYAAKRSRLIGQDTEPPAMGVYPIDRSSGNPPTSPARGETGLGLSSQSIDRGTYNERAVSPGGSGRGAGSKRVSSDTDDRDAKRMR